MKCDVMHFFILFNIQDSNFEVFQGDEDSIGFGGFSTVFRGKNISTDEVLAVKKINLPLDGEGQDYFDTHIKKEVEALRDVNNDNIVRLFHYRVSGNFLYIFLEYCSERDLNRFVVKQQELSDHLSLSFVKGIVSALKCLHEDTHPPVVHRDVKPENLLVARSAQAHSSFVIKLTDFGLASRMPSVSTIQVKTPAIGTFDWRAPETYPRSGEKGQASYGCCVDVFSAGLVILAIANHEKGQKLKPYKGRYPFNSLALHIVSIVMMGQVISKRHHAL